jgi:hypothetical protein
MMIPIDDPRRIRNYEIYQKILEQVSTFKLGSAENLIADFYKRINTELIFGQYY